MKKKEKQKGNNNSYWFVINNIYRVHYERIGWIIGDGEGINTLQQPRVRSENNTSLNNESILFPFYPANRKQTNTMSQTWNKNGIEEDIARVSAYLADDDRRRQRDSQEQHA